MEVVVAGVVVTGTPTASASSGGRSSSSLPVLKAHAALLITIISRLWGMGGGGGLPQTEVYQQSRLQDPISSDIFAKANLGWVFCHLPRD